MITATISHDMRTPLNAIIGMGKALERHLKNEQGRRCQAILMSSAHILLFLVNDLLDLFRIKNNKFTKNALPANIRSHFTELVDVFSMQAQEKGINLELSISNNVPIELTIDI